MLQAVKVAIGQRGLACLARVEENSASRDLELQLIVVTVETWSLEPHDFDPLFARFHVLMATDAAAGVSATTHVLLLYGAYMADTNRAVFYEDGRSTAGTNAVGMWSADRVCRLNDLLYKSAEATVAAGFTNFDCGGVMGLLNSVSLTDTVESCVPTAEPHCGDSDWRRILGDGCCHVIRMWEMYEWPTWNNAINASMSLDFMLCVGPSPMLSYAGLLSQANLMHSKHMTLVQKYLDDEDVVNPPSNAILPFWSFCRFSTSVWYGTVRFFVITDVYYL